VGPFSCAPNLARPKIPNTVPLTPENPRPALLQASLAVAMLLALLAAYTGVMYLLVDYSNVSGKHEASERDLAYVYVHVGLLVVSALVGFVVGKWLSGLGFAFATLFVIVAVLGATFIQMSSYELACHGHNDLVRHWQC